MAFTYDGNPGASDLAATRFLVQDTTNTLAAPAIFTDEEITYTLAAKGSVPAAAIALCLTAARHFARQPGSKTIGDITISYADLSKRYRDLADDLRSDALSSSSTPLPYAGGISVSDEEAVRADVDRDAPKFDNPARRWGNPGSGGGSEAADLVAHYDEP